MNQLTKNKNKKPKRNPNAALSYYSYQTVSGKKNNFIFFWGYRTHVIVSKEDIITIEKLKIISELAPIRERIKMFERKYNCSIEEFKKKLEESEEDFEAWDDYIEWLSYEKKLKELERKLKN